MGHIAGNADALLKRVRRIIGQLEAVERSIVAEDDCATTLHRVAAARGAIGGLLTELLEEHLLQHVAGERLSHEERMKGAEELMASLRRYGR